MIFLNTNLTKSLSFLKQVFQASPSTTRPIETFFRTEKAFYEIACIYVSYPVYATPEHAPLCYRCTEIFAPLHVDHVPSILWAFVPVHKIGTFCSHHSSNHPVVAQPSTFRWWCWCEFFPGPHAERKFSSSVLLRPFLYSLVIAFCILYYSYFLCPHPQHHVPWLPEEVFPQLDGVVPEGRALESRTAISQLLRAQGRLGMFPGWLYVFSECQGETFSQETSQQSSSLHVWKVFDFTSWRLLQSAVQWWWGK